MINYSLSSLFLRLGQKGPVSIRSLRERDFTAHSPSERVFRQSEGWSSQPASRFTHAPALPSRWASVSTQIQHHRSLALYLRTDNKTWLRQHPEKSIADGKLSSLSDTSNDPPISKCVSVESISQDSARGNYIRLWNIKTLIAKQINHSVFSILI